MTTERLRAARDDLGTSADGRLGAVSVGTPHARSPSSNACSSSWVRTAFGPPLRERRASRSPRPRTEASSRRSARLGVRIVSDTCTYISPVMDEVDGPVMTDSGKWAWYAPANLGVEVVIGGSRSAFARRSRGVSSATGRCGPMPEGRTLVAGTAEGPALVLDEPLSLWGGVDPGTGDDRRRAPPAARRERDRPGPRHALGPRLELVLERAGGGDPGRNGARRDRPRRGRPDPRPRRDRRARALWDGRADRGGRTKPSGPARSSRCALLPAASRSRP